MTRQKINEQMIQEFMDLLTGGDLPEGVTMPDQPRLTAKSAFSIIWYLQEILGVLPSNFEMCKNCEMVFDTDCEGHTIGDYDDWYEQMGVSLELVEKYEGAHFCSEVCEYNFLIDNADTADG